MKCKNCGKIEGFDGSFFTLYCSNCLKELLEGKCKGCNGLGWIHSHILGLIKCTWCKPKKKDQNDVLFTR